MLKSKFTSNSNFEGKIQLPKVKSKFTFEVQLSKVKSNFPK
jgi:hypothetical protein